MLPRCAFAASICLMSLSRLLSSNLESMPVMDRSCSVVDQFCPDADVPQQEMPRAAFAGGALSKASSSDSSRPSLQFACISALVQVSESVCSRVCVRLCVCGMRVCARVSARMCVRARMCACAHLGLAIFDHERFAVGVTVSCMDGRSVRSFPF